MSRDKKLIYFVFVYFVNKIFSDIKIELEKHSANLNFSNCIGIAY